MGKKSLRTKPQEADYGRKDVALPRPRLKLREVWCAIAVVFAAVATIPTCITFPSGDRHISVEEQVDAKRVLRTLLSSAQNTFIHRNHGKMAGSIEELGDGFTMGNYGALIYEEIWVARIGCPDSERQERMNKNSKLRSVLARPYRYAILPVKDIYSEALDNRTSCLIAIPEDLRQTPCLVMLAGPIEKDPQDFSRAWKINCIEDKKDIDRIRGWIRKNEFFNREKLNWLESRSEKSKGKEEVNGLKND